MEPVLVSCDGCGARIRVKRPDVVRERACPRCRQPLGLVPVFAAAEAPPDAFEAAPTEPPAAAATPVAVAAVPARPTRLAVLTALGFALVTSAASFGFILGSRPVTADGSPVVTVGMTKRCGNGAATAVRPPAESALARILPLAGGSAPPQPPRPAPEPAPPTPRPSRSGTASKARTAPPEAPAAVTPVPPAPAPAAVPKPSAAPAPALAEAAPKRIRVRARSGRATVARVHGEADSETHILLPDGQLGIPDRLAFTDDPFVPDDADSVARDLLAGPFHDFRILKTAHYVLAYQSTEGFARESGKVLEDLYNGLTDAFERFEVPVHETEFPLVAVVFRTEADFRAHKPVDPEIQAYYEIYTNRIYLYEESEKDEHAPEVAALRRPQTVAHEGTHQILANIGVQPRLAPWPSWLIEGLAEYCATPLSTRKGGVQWSGLGVVNPIHVATVRDLDDPLSAQISGAGRPEPVGRPQGMPMAEYLVRKADLTPTDYALSWALTHYLAKKRTHELVAFLKAMSQLPPFGTRTPERHLADFRAAFGDNLGKLDRDVANHLAKQKLPYQVPYYAVMFQQQVGGGLNRRVLVSQSPSMIRQWIEANTSPRGGAPAWEVVPYTGRTRAVAAAESWVHGR